MALNTNNWKKNSSFFDDLDVAVVVVVVAVIVVVKSGQVEGQNSERYRRKSNISLPMSFNPDQLFLLVLSCLDFFYNDLFCQLQSGAKSVSHLRQSNILKMWQKINGTYSHSFSSVIVQGVGFCEPYYDWTNLLLNITLLNQTLLQKNQQCSLRCFANLALKKANITQHVGSLCLRL